MMIKNYCQQYINNVRVSYQINDDCSFSERKKEREGNVFIKAASLKFEQPILN